MNKQLISCDIVCVINTVDIDIYFHKEIILIVLGAVRIVCSKTTLTGDTRFHISTLLGIEPGSLMMGSERVDHWTSGTVCKYSEIAGYPQGSPQQLTISVVKLEEGPVVSVKP